MNEVASRVVVGASGDDVAIGVGSGAVDVSGDAVKRLLVNDGAKVIAEITHVAHGDFVDLCDIVVLDGIPHRAWDVNAACRTALLEIGRAHV